MPRTPVVTRALVAEWSAKYAKNGTAPGNNSDPTTTWDDHIGGYDGTVANLGLTETTGQWEGAGLQQDPYALHGDGTDTDMEASGPDIYADKIFSFDVWAKLPTALLDLNDVRPFFYISGDASPHDYIRLGIWETQHALAGKVDLTLVNESAAATVIISTATGFNDNKFHHYAATFDASNMRFYVDGVEDGNSPVTIESGVVSINVVQFSASRFYTGYKGTSAYFRESTFSVGRLYNATLTAAEVLQNFNAGKDVSSLDNWKGLEVVRLVNG